MTTIAYLLMALATAAGEPARTVPAPGGEKAATSKNESPTTPPLTAGQAPAGPATSGETAGRAIVPNAPLATNPRPPVPGMALGRMPASYGVPRTITSGQTGGANSNAPLAPVGALAPVGDPQFSVPTFNSMVYQGPSENVDKPFSGYQTPAPISPYINLYRGNGVYGAANDYFTLVRPALEQQAINQQLQEQVRTMNRNTQLQQYQLGQIQQQQNLILNERPQGNYFMNYSQYYPMLTSP